jgi:hypothetical protein
MSVITEPTCRADGQPLEPGARVVVCEECRAPHHEECWTERRRCSTPGCKGRPRAAVLVERVVQADPTPCAVEERLRDLLSDGHQKIDGSLVRTQKNLFDALAMLRNTVASALAEQQERSDRLQAELAQVHLRMRALEHSVGRRLHDATTHPPATPAPPPPPRTAPAAR